MLTISDSTPVFLACGATDMRKNIDGLAALVQHSFNLDPFSSSLFVFCNKGHDKLKILVWNVNGFWLFYRRLEKGRFKWPKHSLNNKTIPISRRELQWLLDGLSLEQPRAHKPVTAWQTV